MKNKIEYLAKRGILGLDAFDTVHTAPEKLAEMYPQAYQMVPPDGTLVAENKVGYERPAHAHELDKASSSMKAVAKSMKETTLTDKMSQDFETAKSSLRNLFSDKPTK